MYNKTENKKKKVLKTILTNKYFQALSFYKGKVPIPQTGAAFSIEGFKSLSKVKYPKFSVLKELSDYGGDGVSVYPNKESLVNSAKISERDFDEISVLFTNTNVGTPARFSRRKSVSVWL